MISAINCDMKFLSHATLTHAIHLWREWCQNAGRLSALPSVRTSFPFIHCKGVERGVANDNGHESQHRKYS